MRRWIVPAVCATLLIGLVLAAGFLWAHHTYTVGIDLNIKALAVLGVAIVIVCVTAFAVMQVMRRRKS